MKRLYPDYNDDFFDKQSLPKAFRLWAFGESHKILNFKGKVVMWNERHPNFCINEELGLSELSMMQKMWIDSVKEEVKKDIF